MGDKMNDPGTTGEQLELDWTASIPEIKPGAVSSIGSDKRGLDIVSGDANWLLRVLGRVRLLFPPCTTEFPRQERRTLFPLRETFAPTSVNNVDSIKLCKPTVEPPPSSSINSPPFVSAMLRKEYSFLAVSGDRGHQNSESEKLESGSGDWHFSNQDTLDTRWVERLVLFQLLRPTFTDSRNNNFYWMGFKIVRISLFFFFIEMVYFARRKIRFEKD